MNILGRIPYVLYTQSTKSAITDLKRILFQMSGQVFSLQPT